MGVQEERNTYQTLRTGITHMEKQRQDISWFMHRSCVAPFFPLSMRFILNSNTLLFLIRKPILVSALHLMPLVVVLVDHEDTIVVEVGILPMVAMIQGEVDALKTGNLWTAFIAVATTIWWITVGTSMANPLDLPIRPSPGMIPPRHEDHLLQPRRQRWSLYQSMSILSSYPS